MESNSGDSVREQALIEVARQGDRSAFCELVRPHLATLRARMRRATAKSPCDPEEVVQETLLRSFASLQNYDPQYTFAQFLFGIARYAVLRAVRERRHEVAVAWTESATEASAETLLPSAEEIPESFHALAGAARFPDPDQRTRSRHRFLALLSVLMAHGGYPHQQLCFGYSVMLWGKAKQARREDSPARQRPDKVEITGDPDRVVNELGPLPLASSGEDFRLEISGREQLDPEVLGDIFEPFDYRLTLTGGELFANDASSRAAFHELERAPVGETTLDLYFGKQPQRSVAEWCRAVKERVRRRVIGEGARSVFPMPPPKDAPHNPPSPREKE